MKKILIIGFCLSDSQALYTELKSLFRVEVMSFNNSEELTPYLKSNPAPNLILINRILDENKKPGLEILKDMDFPAAILTGFESDQKESIKQGAVLSFDLDLLISTLGPKRKFLREKIIKDIGKILTVSPHKNSN